MDTKLKNALGTLGRIVTYLEGENIGKGEFGRAAGFTIPHLNDRVYSKDFQRPRVGGDGTLWLDKYERSKNKDRIRADLSLLIEKVLFKREKIDGRTFIYFPLVPLFELAEIVQNGELLNRELKYVLSEPNRLQK